MKLPAMVLSNEPKISAIADRISGLLRSSEKTDGEQSDDDEHENVRLLANIHGESLDDGEIGEVLMDLVDEAKAERLTR